MNPGPSSRPLRAGVIGSGAISAQHLAFLQHSPKVRLAATCDLSAATATYAAERYGADAAFTDAGEMFGATELDVVHVLTPAHTHVAIATHALESGAHVIVEKPAAPTLDELDELIGHAQRHDRAVTENHNYRFNDGIRELAAQAASGSFGELHEVEVRMALGIRAEGSRFDDPYLTHPIHGMPAGAVHDFITHLVYLLDHFVPGADWDHCAAAWSNHGGGSFSTDDLDASLVGRVDGRTVHGRIRFTALTGPEEFCVTIRGTDGWAHAELFQPYVEVNRPRAGGGQLSPIANHLANGGRRFTNGFRSLVQKVRQHSPYHGLARYLDATYDAFATGAALPIGPEEMRRSAALVDRLVREREPAR